MSSVAGCRRMSPRGVWIANLVSMSCQRVTDSATPLAPAAGAWTVHPATVLEMQRPPITAYLIQFAPALILALSTRPALAEAVYPVSARLTLAPPEQQHCLRVPRANQSDCSVVNQTHTAFSAAVARMFTSDSPAALQLVLTISDADILGTAIGTPELNLRTRVRILSATGEALDEITSLGSAPFFGEIGVGTAAADAGDQAARAFEVAYARSSKVRDWLVGHDIAPAAAVSIPERSDRLVFAAVGGGVVQGGGDSGVAASPSVRVGGSFGWLVLQATYSSYTSSFQGVVPNGFGRTAPANLHVDDLGLEAAASFRITRAIELRAGPGLHYLVANGGFETGGADESDVSSFTRLSPSLFASLTATFLPFRSGLRFFAGFEARGYFFSTVDMNLSGRRIPAANTSFGLTLGGELPWGSSGGRAR